MKIQAKLLIIVSLVMLVIPVLSFADGTPKLFLEDTVKYENSDKVTLNIRMENIESAEKIVALGINVKYDASKLEFTGSKAGKDLKATIKHDQDFPEEGRFSIAIISVSGLSKDGLYYSATFRVKEGVKENIPIELEVSEATDSDGNNINIETTGTIIKLSSEQKEETKILEPTNQVVENFEITEIEPVTSIETVITENGNIEVREEDVLSYEVENSNVIELLDDGTIIPNQDGTSKVKLKLNGQDIGTTIVEVKDGKVVKITGEKDIISETYNTKVNIAELDNVYSEEEIKKSLKPIIEDENFLTNTVETNTDNKNFNWKIVLVIIIILFLMFIFIKKFNMGRKK